MDKFGSLWMHFSANKKYISRLFDPTRPIIIYKNFDRPDPIRPVIIYKNLDPTGPDPS